MEAHAEPCRMTDARRAAERSQRPARRRTCPTDRAPRRPSAGPDARSGRARRPRRSPRSPARSSPAPRRCPARSRARHAAPRPRGSSPRALTGCMKWISASGNICRTKATSASDAQSKCAHAAGADGAQHGRLGIALHGVQHVAGKRLDEGARGRFDGRRAQAVHRLLRPLERDQFVDCRQRCRRSGEAAAQRRDGGAEARLVHGGNPREHAARDRGAPSGRDKRRGNRRHAQMRRGDGDLADAASTSHRGKPISQHRRLPYDPGPSIGRTDRKGRVTSLLCP